MRNRIAIASAVLTIAGLGAFAAISPGDEATGYRALIDREVVHKSIEPASAAQARAASTSLPRRGRRGPRASYFIANDSTAVPAGGSAPITVLSCPRGRKAIAGYYFTSGGIVLDWFSSGNTARKWEFGFIDLTGSGGEGVEGIVCMTRV